MRIDEMPFETFERVAGEPWPGGRSEKVLLLLRIFRIEDAPGTAAANRRLQSYLLSLENMFEPFRVEGVMMGEDLLQEASGDTRDQLPPTMSYLGLRPPVKRA